MVTTESRKAWLKERQGGIGGTDIASICGVGFHSPAEVYADKVTPDPIDREPSPIMLMGLATEPHNAGLYEKRTGARLVSPGIMRAESEPWAFATFDRVRVEGARDEIAGPVELKYAGPFFGDEWGDDDTDQVRDGYVIQTMWQMAILRDRGHQVGRADLSALSGSGEHRVYRIFYDDKLAEMLVAIGREFWALVESRRPVDGWNPPLLAGVAERLVAIRPDTSVHLGRDAEELATTYDLSKAAEKAHREEADRAKARLVALLDGHETGTLPDGRRIRQKVIQRKAYTVQAGSYTDFRVLKAKKGKVQDE